MRMDAVMVLDSDNKLRMLEVELDAMGICVCGISGTGTVIMKEHIICYFMCSCIMGTVTV